MALLDDLNSLLGLAGGVLQTGQGINLLTQGVPDVVSTVRAAPPLPASQFEKELQQLYRGGLQGAFLQQDFIPTAEPDGSIQFTPRPLRSDEQVNQILSQMADENFARALAGGGDGDLSPLGQIGNIRAQAQASGRPAFNREALIRQLQAQDASRAPATGLGLGGGLPAINASSFNAPGAQGFSVGPYPDITTVPTSTATVTSRRSGGLGGSSLASTLGTGALATGGVLGGLALANKLGLLDALRGFFGGSGSIDPTQAGMVVPFPSSNLPLPSPFEQHQFEDVTQGSDWVWVPDGNDGVGSGMGSFDFSSLGNIMSPSDTFTNFADLGFGIDLNP